MFNEDRKSGFSSEFSHDRCTQAAIKCTFFTHLGTQTQNFQTSCYTNTPCTRRLNLHITLLEGVFFVDIKIGKETAKEQKSHATYIREYEYYIKQPIFLPVVMNRTTNSDLMNDQATTCYFFVCFFTRAGGACFLSTQNGRRKPQVGEGESPLSSLCPSLWPSPPIETMLLIIPSYP